MHYKDSMSPAEIEELLREVNELDCKYAEAAEYDASMSQHEAEAEEELCDPMGELHKAALSRGAP